jgi:phospholipid-binding lipoprotein MlaA
MGSFPNGERRNGPADRDIESTGSPVTVMYRCTQNVTGMRSVFARLFCIVAIGLAVGCARSPGVVGPDGVVHRSSATEMSGDLEDGADYDPWQPFNEAMFTFNHDYLDRWLVKPVATGWEKVTPLQARKSLARAIDNFDMPRRLVNNVLQLRPVGAAREVARFVLNTSVGIAGLFDVASMLHLEGSNADTGQTLALYGVSAGPYLVLPTMPPLTVRDAIGRTADGFLDPIGYFLPFVANRLKSIVTAVNERSLNLELYANVEDGVFDLYAAARNGYLQRREAIVLRAEVDRREEWAWALGDPDRPLAASVAKSEDPT